MKRIIAIVLAAVLVVAGLGGFAYAQVNGHQPMAGQKLVGWGAVGMSSPSKVSILATDFNLTNPDCVNEITVDRISVFKADGTVIYEGPLIVGMLGEELTAPLAPHQTVDIFLLYYVLVFEYGIDPTQPADPEDWPESAYYTVETFWTGTKGGLPLTGVTWMVTLDRDEGGNYSSASTMAMGQMVNMTQTLSKHK